MVCQNQDLADSNASLAIDLRQQVFEKIQQGQSDEAIVDYLVARYGDFILFKPAFKTETMVLWMGPMVMLLIGFVVFWRIFRGHHDAS